MPLQTRPLDLSTRDFHAWLLAQGKAIGGSDIGAICGLSQFSNAQDVWDNLVTATRPRSTENNNMIRGHIMEPHIADMYAAETGRQLTIVPSIKHPIQTWRRASPDRAIVERVPGHGGGAGILEIKSLGRETFSEMRTHGIDPSYYAQIMWYMDIFDWRWGAFAIHNLDAWTLHKFDVEYDLAWIEWLRDRATEFWEHNVMERVRPSPIVETSTMPDIAHGGAEAVVRTDANFADAMRALRIAQENNNLSKLALEQAQDAVKALCGNDQLIVVPGHGRISYAESYRTSFDKDALARDYPELNLSLYERRTTTRVFRPTFENNGNRRARR